MNNHIHPVLYKMYLRLKKSLGAELVHRRRRKSSTCVEIVFYNHLIKSVTGRLNTLKEAEACGYWVMCRIQTKRGRTAWRNKTVFQLFLTPVHPKKRREAAFMAAQAAADVTFEPIRTHAHKPSRISKIQKTSSNTCINAKFFVSLHPISKKSLNNALYHGIKEVFGSSSPSLGRFVPRGVQVRTAGELAAGMQHGT